MGPELELELELELDPEPDPDLANLDIVPNVKTGRRCPHRPWVIAVFHGFRTHSDASSVTASRRDGSR
jgi:hypothetical protein